MVVFATFKWWKHQTSSQPLSKLWLGAKSPSPPGSQCATWGVSPATTHIWLSPPTSSWDLPDNWSVRTVKRVAMELRVRCVLKESKREDDVALHFFCCFYNLPDLVILDWVDSSTFPCSLWLMLIFQHGITFEQKCRFPSLNKGKSRSVDLDFDISELEDDLDLSKVDIAFRIDSSCSPRYSMFTKQAIDHIILWKLNSPAFITF